MKGKSKYFIRRESQIVREGEIEWEVVATDRGYRADYNTTLVVNAGESLTIDPSPLAEFLNASAKTMELLE